MVVKNNLMSIAATQASEANPKLASLAEAKFDLDNAWLITGEETLGSSIKSFNKAVEALKKENKELQLDARMVYFDGQILDGSALSKLEKMPSREELYAKIAMLVKAVPTKLARSINAIPTKVGRSIKLVSDLDEDKTKLVSEVAQN